MMFKNNIAYIIIDPNAFTQDMINGLKASFGFSTINELRHNDQRTKMVVSFDVKNSCAFDGIQWFTHGEILIEMAKTEWDIRGVVN